MKLERKSFTFYYNDDPKIAENWFTDDILKNVTIRNLGRSDIEISSTMIRDLLYKKDYDKVKGSGSAMDVEGFKAAWKNPYGCNK